MWTNDKRYINSYSISLTLHQQARHQQRYINKRYINSCSHRFHQPPSSPTACSSPWPRPSSHAYVNEVFHSSHLSTSVRRFVCASVWPQNHGELYGGGFNPWALLGERYHDHGRPTAMVPWHVPALAGWAVSTKPTHARVERSSYVKGAALGISVDGGSQCVAHARRTIMEENGQASAFPVENSWHLRRELLMEDVRRLLFFFFFAFGRRRWSEMRERPGRCGLAIFSRHLAFVLRRLSCIQVQELHPIISGSLRRNRQGQNHREGRHSWRKKQEMLTGLKSSAREKKLRE